MAVSRWIATMALSAFGALYAGNAFAVELAIVAGSVGKDISELRNQLDEYQKQSGNTVKIVEMPASSTDQFGQFRLWLAAGNTDVDIYRTDVIWAPQLASGLLDLSEPMKDMAAEQIPSTIASQTVDGRLVAFPFFTDAPALYYRKDLLEKYGKAPPKTWAEMATTAKEIQDKERATGNAQMYGFVFQGAPYEGLTCDALEWVASHGGGRIVDEKGDITINNPKAVEALEQAKSWVGSIAPEGVLGYKEEESRGVWQVGNAVFMRNWPYAFDLSQGEGSAVAGKFAVMPLPAGADGGQSSACLGGWNLAISKYSEHPDEAVDLVRYLTSEKAQKERALGASRLPTYPGLYKDPEIEQKVPIVAEWEDVVTKAVPRPSAPTKGQYNEVSQEFWTAANETLSGRGSAADNLEKLEKRLRRLRRSAWK